MTNINVQYAALLVLLCGIVVVANVAAFTGSPVMWVLTFVLLAGWGLALARFARSE